MNAGKQRGFTLIELAATMAIAMILLTMTGFGLHKLIQYHRLTTTVNEFFSAIQLARSEAIQRGGRVDLVPAGSGRDWSEGWVVFIDRNANLKPDASERIIFSRGPVAKGMLVQSRFTDADRPYLAYNASGRSRTDASSLSPQFGTVVFTLGDEVRKIKINFLGRPRACNPALSGSNCSDRVESNGEG